MEPITILIAVAGIVATGALSRVGEVISDDVRLKLRLKAKELLSRIRTKSPDTANIIENAERQSLDYGQVYPKIEEITRNDLAIKRLLQEIKELILADQKVAKIVEEELNRAIPQLATIIEDWKGVNIKGGINTITGNTFQF